MLPPSEMNISLLYQEKVEVKVSAHRKKRRRKAQEGASVDASAEGGAHATPP